MHVACGKCFGCLVNRRKAWLLRLKKELNYSVCGYHLTLQLDDDNIGDNVVHKEVLQKYIKRLRKSGLVFSYYAIGEYGTNDKRAHYHMAVFLKKEVNFEEFHRIVNEKWKKGYIFITRLNERRMNYVLHYHIRPKIVDNRPTFAINSNCLGSEWFNSNLIVQWMVKTGRSHIHVDGTNYVIPRYYRKKYNAPATKSNYVYDFKRLVETITNKPYYELDKNTVEKLRNSLIEISLKKLKKYNKQKI